MIAAQHSGLCGKLQSVKASTLAARLHWHELRGLRLRNYPG
jgi:hypothetical protein